MALSKVKTNIKGLMKNLLRLLETTKLKIIYWPFNKKRKHQKKKIFNIVVVVNAAYQ